MNLIAWIVSTADTVNIQFVPFFLQNKELNEIKKQIILEGK